MKRLVLFAFGLYLLPILANAQVACPQYQQPICPSGQHVQQGTVNQTTGCTSAPQCVADASSQPLTVTLKQPAQPVSGQAFAGQTVAAVAITVEANTLAHITGIKVQKVGSLNNAAITKLQVNSDQNTVVGTASGFDANNTVTIPVTSSIAAGTSKIFLVSAVMASDLTSYLGQSFELNITAVTSDAVTTNGTLPVYGAQFTISTNIPKPTCSISSTSGTYHVGQTINIRWTSTNATGGTITGIGSVGPSGLQGILPGGQSQTLVGTFTGPGGTGTCSLTLRLTDSSGGVVEPGGVDSTGSVSGAGGSFGSTNGGTVTPGVGSGGTSNVSVPNTPAAQGNIIPCSGLDCRPCDLAALAQNVINYLIGLTIPLAAVMFAWAGILYFTSATRPINIEKAKSVFRVVFWGFLIVIGSWLMVQTLLRFTLGSTYYQNWNVIQCNLGSNRPGSGQPGSKSTDAATFFGNIGGLNLGNPGEVPLSTSGSITGGGGSVSANDYVSQNFTGNPTSCPAGYTYLDDAQLCSNSDGTDFKDPNFSGAQKISVANSQMAAYINSACEQYGLSNCNLAASIAQNESSGGRNCTTSNTGAAGCMQVLATTACTLDGSISSDCGSCLSSRNSIRPQCAPVIQAIQNDPQMGVNLGVQYITQLSNQYGGDCRLTAAAYFQGPGAVKKYGGVPPNAVSYVNKACN